MAMADTFLTALNRIGAVPALDLTPDAATRTIDAGASASARPERDDSRPWMGSTGSIPATASHRQIPPANTHRWSPRPSDPTRPHAQTVAVGTVVAGRPPHRSQRAGLPHWAPALGNGVESLLGPGMQDPRLR